MTCGSKKYWYNYINADCIIDTYLSAFLTIDTLNALNVNAWIQRLTLVMDIVVPLSSLGTIIVTTITTTVAVIGYMYSFICVVSFPNTSLDDIVKYLVVISDKKTALILTQCMSFVFW